MKNHPLFKSKYFKFLAGMFLVWCVIFIAKSGYDFGQYLYAIIHR